MAILCWIRSFIASLLFVVLTLAISLSVIVEIFTVDSRKIQNWLAEKWGLWTCRLFFVRLYAKGLENVPKEGCIFLFNHSSFFDIFSLQALVPHLRFGAKIELFKIPIFAEAIRRLGVLPIARERRQEVFKIYEEAKIRFAHGDQFALAPEGTRNLEEKLRPFKSGPFVFAINSQVPVVPVVIRGAFAVMPKKRVLANSDKWSRDIHVTFLKPISTQGMTMEQKDELQKKVYQEMEPFFKTDLAKTAKE